MDREQAEIMASRKATTDLLAKYEKDYVSDAEDKKRLDKVRATLVPYYAVWEQLRPLSEQTEVDPSKLTEAAAMMNGPSAKAFSDVEAAVQSWWDYNEQLSDVATKSSKATGSEAT